MPLHPIQPLVLDANDVLRFQRNRIVEHLLDHGPFDMNYLAVQGFSQADQEQFAQLIGYSLSGFAELSYVRSHTLDRALALDTDWITLDLHNPPEGPVWLLMEGPAPDGGAPERRVILGDLYTDSVEGPHVELVVNERGESANGVYDEAFVPVAYRPLSAPVAPPVPGERSREA